MDVTKSDMQTTLNNLLPSLQSLGLWGYWVIGLLAFGEALILTSVFSPGTIVVLIGGVLVAQGLYDFGDMVCFVAVGTIFWAEASFRIGLRGGHLFQDGRWIFSTANLDRGKRFLAKYGAPSIILGHFFGPLRPIVPVVAGLSGMSRKRFFLWNVVGGLAYTIVALSVGYFFGTALDFVSATLTRAGLFALAVLLVMVILWFLGSKLRQALPFVVSVLRTVGQAIRENPDVESLVRRHPDLFRFLKKRLSREQFSGLPASLLVAAITYFLLLYVSSTFDYVTQGQIIQIDERLANLMVAFRDPWLTAFFTIVTAFGSGLVVLVLAIAASFILWLGHRLHYLPGLWIVLIGNMATVILLKNLFSRARPALAVYGESSYSFPSGHSSVAVAFFGFLTYVVIRERICPAWVSFVAGAIIVFLIGLSRIYLVEHYLSDVLNGYLVGVLWALLGVWLAEWLRTKAKPAVGFQTKATKISATLGVIAGTLIAVWFAVDKYHQKLNPHLVSTIAHLDQSVEEAFAAGRLPAYSESILGTRQEPISLIILAPDEATFLQAFVKAGWHRADRPGFTTLSRAAFAIWFDTGYDTAPVTPGFWNNQPHGYGFQSELRNIGLRQRHHARFWKSDFRTPEGLLIFVGTASFDDGLKWGLTHRIDPNIDAERDLLLTDLQKAGAISSAKTISLVAPVLGENLTGDPFFTDGKAVLILLAPYLTSRAMGAGPKLAQ